MPAARRRRGRGRGRAAAGHVQSGRSSISGGRPEGLGSRRSSSAAMAVEVVHVAHAPGPPAAGRGDLAQGDDVDGVARGGALLEVLGAEGDGVDAHAVLGGEPGDLARVEAGGGVAAVGEQHDDARAGRVGEDALQREAEAVGDGGGAAGEADLGALDGAGDGGEVVGQRRGHVGAVGEDDDADAVAAAGLDEARRPRA